jgi:N-acetylglucosaminylphosphatidylinositol deacetylase
MFGYGLVIVAIPWVIWQLIYYGMPNVVPSGLANKNIVLVTAHPDDEVMFFGPTLTGLMEPSLNNTVSILCLSTGNATGIGKMRTMELYKSAHILNFTDPTFIQLVDHPGLQDSMDTYWDAGLVSRILDNKVTADTMITFDDQGISSHPNHISVHNGAMEWMKQDAEHRRVWKLDTVPLYRKYLFSADSFVSYFLEKIKYTDYGSTLYTEQQLKQNKALLIARQNQFDTIRRAMISGHASQMVWYRWGWIQFSRYMVVNDLTEVY